MTEMKIAITNKEVVIASYRLDYQVDSTLFLPAIKTSVLKTIYLALTDLDSFHYEFNQNLDGILITVLDGQRKVSTSMSREESLFLLKELMKNGCVFRIFLATPFDTSDNYE